MAIRCIECTLRKEVATFTMMGFKKNNLSLSINNIINILTDLDKYVEN